MRLLLFTQKVDSNDPILGFFYDWIMLMSLKYEKILVICLSVGGNDLPSNVKVLSLGKEKNSSKIYQLLKFYYYIFKNSFAYDCVFVHMNSIYVVLGGWWWRLLNKKIALWYIHPKKDLMLYIATFFVNYIFTATKNSFPIKTNKIILFGHGININKFKSNKEDGKIENSVLFVGRITPIKKLDILIDAIRILHNKNFNIRLHIYGDIDNNNLQYFEDLKNINKDLQISNIIIFHKAVTNNEMPQIYNCYELLVNLTTSGSFDKVILEAAACETLVITTNKLFDGLLPEELLIIENNPDIVAEKIKEILFLSQDTKNSLAFKSRQMIIEKNNLDNVVNNIVKILS